MVSISTKRFLTLSIVTTFVLCAFLCIGKISPAVNVSAETVTPKINHKKVVLVKGQKVKLKVDGVDSKIKWSSNKNAVAKVTKKGKVIAKKEGAATITAKYKKKKLTCKIIVKNMKLSKEKLTMTPGQSQKIKLMGAKKKVTWKSSNSKVASVKNGRIKAKNIGKATITATVEKKKYKCKVTVKAGSIPVESLYLDEYSISIPEGTSKTIGYSIYPSNATNQTVKWSISNEAVATVDATGKITGKSIGQTVLTATCGEIKETCNVSVTRNFNVDDANRSISYESYRTYKGVVSIVANNYKYPASVDVSVTYYNAEKALIGTGSDSISVLHPGEKCAVFCYAPTDLNYDYVDYSSYGVTINASETSLISCTKNISLNGNFGADNVVATIKNNGDDLSIAHVSIVFYKNGKVVGYDYTYAEIYHAGQVDYLEYNFPYDENDNRIVPDAFELYMYAYK